MTPHEKESLDVERQLMDAITRGRITRVEFQMLMGKLRDNIRRLEALQGGCPAGAHLSPCTCKPAVRGVTKNEQYRRGA